MVKQTSKTKQSASSREREVIALIEGRGIGDKVEEIYGPIRVADSQVWEAWVYNDDDELATRFVEEPAGGSPLVIDTFQQLAVRLDILHEELFKRAQEIEWRKTKEMMEIQAKASVQGASDNRELIKLIVAAALFAFALGALVFVIWNGSGGNQIIAMGAIASVVGSACVLFFGKFIKFPSG